MSCSNHHYLPSEALTGIVKANLVPESLLDTIHHDYVTCEEERRYYCEFWIIMSLLLMNLSLIFQTKIIWKRFMTIFWMRTEMCALEVGSGCRTLG